MTVRNSLKFALAAPLALVLAACGGDADGEVQGDAIDPIEAPEGANWTDTVTISESDGYILGNPDAPIKLVEYASHTCGGCASFSASAKPGIKEYVETGVVSFEQRNLVRDPIDLAVATLVRCGANENMQVLSDEAWRYLPQIFENVQQNSAAYEAAGQAPVDQRFIGIAQAAGLIDFFAARGLSADQQRACLADTAKIEAIADNSSAQASELNITSTPTFILNGNKLDAIGWNDVEAALQRAGARQE
ncbi:DsbA family protein [Qipengyuania sp. S6317L1]|uniref:thioredoxin domain-containing protein n=1 Tax=Qipengyuania sp. S6317L1 TaxID=2926410 RepID=UPI001FF2AA9B|nr:thioredoxin domain-containing protein [Qipengyuania sp. S6317L1]MCK0098267.1 DsbA family protein [Qipengyuania sp. S6317L1]